MAVRTTFSPSSRWTSGFQQRNTNKQRTQWQEKTTGDDLYQQYLYLHNDFVDDIGAAEIKVQNLVRLQRLETAVGQHPILLQHHHQGAPIASVAHLQAGGCAGWP